MTTMPTISLCMIVRDEELYVARAIASVRAYVNEIIAVDTGSTDSTPQILQTCGATVLPFSWIDDFSAARNHALECARGSWILVLDADEALDSRDAALLPVLVTDQSRCYEVRQRHYTDNVKVTGFTPCKGEYPQWERANPGYFDTYVVRLFPNHAKIRFRGRVHEVVEDSIAELKSLQIARTELTLHHYGHTSEIKSRRPKGELYEKLASKKTGESDAPWRAFYELGIEQISLGKFQSSVENLEKAARLNPRFVTTWVNLGYVLCELGRHEHAKRALQRALELDKSCAEAHCNLGVVALRLGLHDVAASHFSEALTINPEYVNAYCNLGKVLVLKGDTTGAGGCYLRALEIDPRCVEAKIDLAQIYLGAGALTEAHRLLNQVLAANPNSVLALYTLAQLHRAQGNTEVANDLLERALSSPQPNESALLQAIRKDLGQSQ